MADRRKAKTSEGNPPGDLAERLVDELLGFVEAVAMEGDGAELDYDRAAMVARARTLMGTGGFVPRQQRWVWQNARSTAAGSLALEPDGLAVNVEDDHYAGVLPVEQARALAVHILVTWPAPVIIPLRSEEVAAERVWRHRSHCSSFHGDVCDCGAG
jgi:hypothetical protein